MSMLLNFKTRVFGAYITKEIKNEEKLPDRKKPSEPL
jgi:hypothetical protein